MPAICQPTLSFTISQSLLKLTSTESMMPFNHLILCCPLLLLPSIFPSLRVFSSELALSIRWPKYWSFSISPSSEYSRLISFRIDQFDLFAVPGTHKSPLGQSNNDNPLQWWSQLLSRRRRIGRKERTKFTRPRKPLASAVSLQHLK